MVALANTIFLSEGILLILYHHRVISFLVLLTKIGNRVLDWYKKLLFWHYLIFQFFTLAVKAIIVLDLHDSHEDHLGQFLNPISIDWILCLHNLVSLCFFYIKKINLSILNRLKLTVKIVKGNLKNWNWSKLQFFISVRNAFSVFQSSHSTSHKSNIKYPIEKCLRRKNCIAWGSQMSDSKWKSDHAYKNVWFFAS